MEDFEKVKLISLKDVKKVLPNDIAYLTLKTGEVIIVNGLNHEKFNKKEREYEEWSESQSQYKLKNSLNKNETPLQNIREDTEENERNSNLVNNEQELNNNKINFQKTNLELNANQNKRFQKNNNLNNRAYEMNRINNRPYYTNNNCTSNSIEPFEDKKNFINNNIKTNDSIKEYEKIEIKNNITSLSPKMKRQFFSPEFYNNRRFPENKNNFNNKRNPNVNVTNLSNNRNQYNNNIRKNIIRSNNTMKNLSYNNTSTFNNVVPNLKRNQDSFNNNTLRNEKYKVASPRNKISIYKNEPKPTLIMDNSNNKLNSLNKNNRYIHRFPVKIKYNNQTDNNFDRYYNTEKSNKYYNRSTSENKGPNNIYITYELKLKPENLPNQNCRRRISNLK